MAIGLSVSKKKDQRLQFSLVLFSGKRSVLPGYLQSHITTGSPNTVVWMHMVKMRTEAFN
ncbi:hypothetical protein SR70_06580 [Klebsiella aerogenes]|nr:hypothetical protein SR70_06580 [Klebsiella aerogenes]